MEEPGGASSVRGWDPLWLAGCGPVPACGPGPRPASPLSCLYCPSPYSTSLSFYPVCFSITSTSNSELHTSQTHPPRARPLVAIAVHPQRQLLYLYYFFYTATRIKSTTVSSLTKSPILSQPDTNNTVAPPSPPPPSEKMSTSSTNSWLRQQRKSDLVEVAETVGLKE
jgi:hypothetical protein